MSGATSSVSVTSNGCAPKDVKAVQAPCGLFPPFQGEVYFFETPQTTTSSSSAQSPQGLRVFWVLRWIVDFLGSASAKNFLGISVPNWRARVASELDHLNQSDDAASHILDSSWSTMKQREGEAVDSTHKQVDSAVDCQDFCISNFGILLLLVRWAHKGPRQNSSWKLSATDFKARAAALLLALLCFVLPQSIEEKSFLDIRIAKSPAGHPQIHLPALCAGEDGKFLQKSFPSQVWFPLDEALVQLDIDEANKNYSPARRTAAATTRARLLWFVTTQVESSIGSPIWERTQLHQLEQLRTHAAEDPLLGFIFSLVVYFHHVSLRSWRTHE